MPKPDPRSKRAQIAAEAPKVSRLDKMRKDRIAPAMPRKPLPHIVDRLVEMGLTEAAGMGVAAISWREIDAWCARTGVDLDPWEARLIRRLSVEYVAEGRRAESESCPPPWHAPVTQREVDSEEAALRALLG